MHAMNCSRQDTLPVVSPFLGLFRISMPTACVTVTHIVCIRYGSSDILYRINNLFSRLHFAQAAVGESTHSIIAAAPAPARREQFRRAELDSAGCRRSIGLVW